MSNTYYEIKPEYRRLADLFEEKELQYRVYNHGIQFNVTDVDGVVQTFYPSTGTIVFHASNDRKDTRIMTFRKESVESFLSYITERGRISQLFK